MTRCVVKSDRGRGREALEAGKLFLRERERGRL
jgi:hypothetical protein